MMCEVNEKKITTILIHKKIKNQLWTPKNLIKVMKKWNGKVVEVPYTKGVSTSMIRKYYTKKK